MTQFPSHLHTKAVWGLTAAAFFAFFVFGFTDNLKGPVLPALLSGLQFSYSVGGALLFGIYLGFMAATLVTGLAADAWGLKAVLVFAGVSLALGTSGFGSFASPIWLTLSAAVLGFGLGSLELGCNALIVRLHPADKGRYLNLMAVMHGLGSMLAPLYAGWMLSAGNAWRNVYLWSLAPIGLLLGSFTLAHLPRGNQLGREAIDFSRLGKTAFEGKLPWYYTAIGLYVAVELGIASWIVEFLQQARAQGVAQSTLYLSAFFGLIMLGRFLGSFFVERIGYLRAILVAGLGASACIALGVFGPEGFSILLPASGFLLSIIFPTITAAVSGFQHENLNSVLGLLFTFAGLGGIAGPWLVGVASDLAGIEFGFGLNLAFSLLTAASALVLLRQNGS
jgi:fucose permease